MNLKKGLIVGALIISLGTNIFQFNQNNQKSALIQTMKHQLSIKSEAENLRLGLDIEARRFLKALVTREKNLIREMVADNIVVDDKQLIIRAAGSNESFTYQYPQRLGELRQHTYFIDERGRYITRYYSEGDGEGYYIELTFKNTLGKWKIESIGNDK